MENGLLLSIIVPSDNSFAKPKNYEIRIKRLS